MSQETKYFMVSYHFKVLDAEMYGGIGSTGYSCMNFGFENHMKCEPQDVVEDCRDNLSKMLGVGVENIISISHVEYEENTED